MYLLRLDDASEYWDKEKWHRMHDLLFLYGIKPIVAIIPNNKSVSFLKYPLDSDFSDTVRAWMNEGWTPALHGCDHILDSKQGGINPVNLRSEFAGKSLEVQEEKIQTGYEKLLSMGIKPSIFVSPAHTFDENTLSALRNKSDIRIISDTIARDVYFKDDFFFIPQISGQVRRLSGGLTTFCYHPNTTTDEQFIKLENFLKKYSSEFIPFDKVNLKYRKKSIFDKLLSAVYFVRRKIIRVLQHK